MMRPAAGPRSPIEEPTFNGAGTPIGPVLLTVVAALAAAAIGGLGNSLIRTYARISFPLVPGFLVGYAVSYFWRKRSIAMAVFAGFCGFAGMVFGDALTYNLPQQDGFLYYITHFWLAANTMKVIFWLLNAGIAFNWTLRSATEASGALPSGLPGTRHECSACGHPNSADSTFCSRCGTQLS